MRIGKYLARRTLGVGSFATVWLADDELLDAQVAIKVLADNWARHPDVRRRFIDEAKLLRRIDHERIVRVHDVDELPDGRPYFVMTWADRGTLQERLVNAPGGTRQLGVDEAVRLAIEICECLAVVHDFGAVHRDIKPSNVLFRSVRSHERSAAQRRGLELGDEQLVLGDFGLAKDLAAASGFTMAAGTPAYMAPEQARPSAIIDRRVDVFGVSAVLYEMLAGRPALAASTLSDVRRNGEEGAVAPLRSLRPDVPPVIAAVVARGLSFEPAQRYPGALELAEALRDGLAAARPAGEVAPPSTSSLSSSNGLALMGAAGRVRDLVALVRGHGLAPVAALDAIESALAAPVGVVVVPSSAWSDLRLPDGAVRGDRDGDGDCDVDAPDAVDGPGPFDALGQFDAVATADVVAVVVPASAGGREDDVVRLVEQVGAALRIATVGPIAVVVVADDPASTSALGPVRALTTDVLSDDDGRELVAAIAETLVHRRSLLRAADGLTALEAEIEHGAQPNSASGRDVRDALETLRLELPALAEIDALRADIAGRWTLAAPLRREMRRILLWSAPEQRLDRTDASSAELEDAARQALERWRTLRNTDRVPFAARSVAELVERSLERLWVELSPSER